MAKHLWKAKLGVALAMLALAFLGMVVTDVRATGGWDYWKWMVPVYAVLALSLSWYSRRQVETVNPITLWHELIHWIGLILAVFLISHFYKLGLISRFAAGLFDLILIALTVFLLGIYIDSIFILIGICLGIFAFMAGVVFQYFYAFIVPIIVAAAIIVALAIWFSHNKTKMN